MTKKKNSDPAFQVLWPHFNDLRKEAQKHNVRMRGVGGKVFLVPFSIIEKSTWSGKHLIHQLHRHREMELDLSMLERMLHKEGVAAVRSYISLTAAILSSMG